MKHSIGIVPAAATLTKIFTVPPGHKALVTAVTVNVGAATAKTFTIYWQFADDASYKVYLSRAQSHATQDYPQQFTGNLIMQQGDSLWFDSEAGSTPSVIASFDLYQEKNIHTFD